MAKKRTELEARLLEEHGRVISVVQRWQSEQQAVDEVRASLANTEAWLDDAVLHAADLGDQPMVAWLVDLREAHTRKNPDLVRYLTRATIGAHVSPPNHRPSGHSSTSGTSPVRTVKWRSRAEKVHQQVGRIQHAQLPRSGVEVVEQTAALAYSHLDRSADHRRDLLGSW